MVWNPRERCGTLVVRMLVAGGLLALAHCGGSGGGTPTPPPPASLALTGASPGSGFTSGGATLTLTGAGFVGNSAGTNAVTVDGMTATSVVTVDDTTITCVVPAHAVGAVDVAVTNANGTETLTGGFTYCSFPPYFPVADTPLNTNTLGASLSSVPVMCRDGSTLYIAWEDDRDGQYDIRFNRSADGGATWQISDIRLDTDTAGAAASRRPKICCAGTNVYVLWQDFRNGGSDIYFNRSTDGGATWLTADVRVDTDTPGAAASYRERICCNGSNVYAVWQDERSTELDIYFNRSTDGGATWETSDTRLDTDGIGASRSWYPAIWCEGDTVSVVWEDLRDGLSDIRLNRSTNGGATWLASDLRIDTDAPGSGSSKAPEICGEGSMLYVAWYEARDGLYDIYFNRSTSGGANWEISDVRLNTNSPGSSFSWLQEICCSGSDVWVVWSDARDGAYDIYLNRSANSGATWLATDVRLDTDTAGAFESRDQVICCDGSNVYVVWRDVRDGQADIRTNVSRDSGATWLAADLRLDTDTAGAAESRYPSICCDGATLFAVWLDYRNGGLSDIYFTASEP